MDSPSQVPAMELADFCATAARGKKRIEAKNSEQVLVMSSFAPQRSVEANFDVGALFEMDGFDKAHLAIIERKNHGMQADTFAEEANTAKEAAVGNAGAGKDHPFSRRKVGSVVNAFWVFDAHSLEALGILRLGHDQAAEDLSI